MTSPSVFLDIHYLHYWWNLKLILCLLLKLQFEMNKYTKRGRRWPIFKNMFWSICPFCEAINCLMKLLSPSSCRNPTKQNSKLNFVQFFIASSLGLEVVVKWHLQMQRSEVHILHKNITSFVQKCKKMQIQLYITVHVTYVEKV